MKKIYAGIISIMAVLTIVGVSAYALFSSQVTMSGIVLGTTTPGLLIGENKSNPPTINWQSSLDFSGINGGDVFAPLLPGKTDWGEIFLKNTSNGESDPLLMNLTARLTAAGGDWGTLKDAIQMKVCLYKDSSAAPHCDEDNATGWATLAYWNGNNVPLPGSPLSQNVETHYVMVFQIPSGYGNEIAGKKITGMSFAVTGTQTP